MLNAVGREIPEEILERTGKEVFQGNNYKDGKAFQKASPKVTPVMRNDHDKMVKDIHEALVKCNAHDGMTVSFHHHFREGDLVVCMVMEEIHKMGFKNITLSASSLGKAHDALVPMIEDGTIVNIESSGVRGKIGDAISHGKLKGPATEAVTSGYHAQPRRPCPRHRDRRDPCGHRFHRRTLLRRVRQLLRYGRQDQLRRPELCLRGR